MDHNHMSAICCRLFRNFSYWRLKGSEAAQALGHRPLIAEAWVQTQTTQRGIFFMENVKPEQFSLRVQRGCPVSIIPAMLHSNFSCIIDVVIPAVMSVVE